MKRIVVKGATTVRIVCQVRLKSAGVKGRNISIFWCERYSREVLIAEMGAAFLCAMTGTDVPVVEN